MTEAPLDIPIDAEPLPMDDLKEEMIPIPVGYHLLIKMPEVEQTFGGSLKLLKTTETVRHDTVLNMVGLVLDAGDDAYGDKTKFPNGPWCKVGDYVMFRSNSGTRFKISGQEFRLLNDDSVEAVVKDPSAITRVN